MRAAPVVEGRWLAHIKGAFDATHRVIHCPEGCRVGKATIGLLPFYSEVWIVVVLREVRLATRQVVGSAGTFTRGHRLADACQLLLPDSHAVVPADALVDGCGPNASVCARLEVEERLPALDGEPFVRGFGEDCLVVCVALACHIVVTIHDTSLDVNLYVGPLAEGLGHRLRVGRINNIEEGIRFAVHNVQSLLKHLALLGRRDEVVACTTGYV